MSFQVDNTIKGVLFLSPETAVPVFNEEFKKGMTEATLLVQYETANRTPVNTGMLRKSIGSTVIGTTLDMKGIVGTPLQYALPVEEGAAPHFPPTGPIELWVKRKVGQGFPAKEIASVAFLIARKINITGLKAHNMFSDALVASQSRIDEILKLAQERVHARLRI